MPRAVKDTITVPGFLFGGIASGIKKGKKKDLALIVARTPATAAGVFTTNRVKAAPVLIDQKRIRSGRCRAIVINSGCANACTGSEGIGDAREVGRTAARCLGIPEETVLLASTGLIGTRLPVGKIARGIRKIAPRLKPEGLMDAARAIMTTDTFPKVAWENNGDFIIAGIAKGAGMIHPRMATMLCFLMTDAAPDRKALDRALRHSVDRSFHQITVDGDTSTNDTVIIAASGCRSLGKKGIRGFQRSLDTITRRLAEMIVEDAEGGTKKVEICVRGARTSVEARTIAERVASSPLVKTAFFGEDPNWGRIMAAVGASGIAIHQDRVDVFIGRVRVVRKGTGCGVTSEERARRVLQEDAPSVTIDLHGGRAEARILTCDLSYEYVRINAAYST